MLISENVSRLHLNDSLVRLILYQSSKLTFEWEFRFSVDWSVFQAYISKGSQAGSSVHMDGFQVYL